MINRWVYNGELDDPFGEFFVTLNTSEDDSWGTKYKLEKEMIPSFIPTDVAEKVSFELTRSS